MLPRLRKSFVNKLDYVKVDLEDLLYVSISYLISHFNIARMGKHIYFGPIKKMDEEV